MGLLSKRVPLMPVLTGPATGNMELEIGNQIFDLLVGQACKVLAIDSHKEGRSHDGVAVEL